MRGAKIIINMLVSIICVTSCTNKYKMYNIENIVEMKNATINTEKSKLSNAFLDVSIYKDSLMFITDLFSRAMFKYTLQNNQLIQIGKNGEGPGEYITPAGLAVRANIVTLLDHASGRLQKYSFDGEYIGSIREINKYWGERIVYDSQNTLYLLSDNVKKEYLKNINGETFYEKQKCFITNGGRRAPNMIVKDDIIYFMNPYELAIYSYDIAKKTKKINYLTDVKGYYDWKPYYNKGMSASEFSAKISTEAKVLPIALFKLEIKDKLCFIVKVNDSEKNNVLHYIVNQEGKILLIFKSDDYGLIATYEDTMIFTTYSISKEVVGFVLCQLSKNVIDANISEGGSEQ